MGNSQRHEDRVVPVVPTEAESVRVIATHNGVFQADDALAVAALEILYPRARVIRTRDKGALEGADIVVDVGGEYDPVRRRFDHHQQGRAGARPNGVLYSAFGLVWRHYGIEVCKHLGVTGFLERVSEEVDVNFVQGIDALDNGQAEVLGERGLVRGTSLSGLIASINPTWQEPSDAKAFDDSFLLATSVARLAIERAVASATARVAAEAAVKAAIARREDPAILVLDRGGLPWQEAVFADDNSQLEFVVFPSAEGTWMVQCVPDALGSFGKRKPLPEAWAGLRDEAFQEATGVRDGVFCHPGLFICGAASKAGALRLAELAGREDPAILVLDRL